MKERIIKRYKNCDYHYLGDTKNGMKFANQFSRHFVFIISNFQELQAKWQELHKEVIQEYIDFKEESFFEWNFYCIFILDVESISDDDRKYILQIEQDRSYSRKYIRLSSEIEMLPPGRICPEDIGICVAPIEDIIGHWETTLGNSLFSSIMSGNKNEIENNLKRLLED